MNASSYGNSGLGSGANQWVPPAGAGPAGGTIDRNAKSAGHETDRVLIVDQIGGRIAVTNSRLIDLLQATRQYVDSLLGGGEAKGAGTATDGGPRPPLPRLEGLSSAVNSTDDLVTALCQQFDRIRQV